MQARRLKHKVVFQEQTEEKNSFGEVTNTWNDVLTCRVDIKTISGKETYLSNQNYSTLSHKIWCRYLSKINSKQRVKFGERIFKILAVLNVKEANKELEILCEEVV